MNSVEPKYKLVCDNEDYSKAKYYKYCGFWILPNKNHNRFRIVRIEQFDTTLAVKYTLESALRWCEELAEAIYN